MADEPYELRQPEEIYPYQLWRVRRGEQRFQTSYMRM